MYRDYDAAASPTSDEQTLVARARQGDSHAFAELYDAYLPRLFRYCRGRVGDPSDAEDLCEDVFLKVFQALPRFEWRDLPGEGRSPFAAWLFRIARNHIVSHHRRSAARPPQTELQLDMADERRGPQELAETRMEIEEVFAAVRRLPDAQREVIVLRFAAGLSVGETASVLEKKENNVKVLQHKGIRRLRLLLAAQEAGSDAEVVLQQASVSEGSA